MFLLINLGSSNMFPEQSNGKITAKKIGQKLAVELPTTISIADLEFALKELIGYEKVKTACTNHSLEVGSRFQ
jgi:hypothetical protein